MLKRNIPLTAVGRCKVVPLLIVRAPVELKVESVVAVKAPVIARDVPFQVKLALSVRLPPVPANVTRPDVRDESVRFATVNKLPSNVMLEEPDSTLLPFKYWTWLAVPPLWVTVLDVVSVVKAPVFAVVAPTVPFIGPANPVDVSVVPSQVKLDEPVKILEPLRN